MKSIPIVRVMPLIALMTVIEVAATENRQLRDQISQQHQQAQKQGTAQAWWAVVEWVDSVAPQEEKVEQNRQALRQARIHATRSAVELELKALSTEDREGHLKLAQKAHELLYKTAGDHDTRRKVFARYLSEHPEDLEFYTAAVSGEEGQYRFSANDARSEGWLRKLRQTPTAEGYLQAGRWHAGLDEKEYWRAPSRAVFCYLNARKLGSGEESPDFREYFLRLTAHRSPENALQIAAIDEKGNIPMVDYRPQPVQSDVAREEGEKMKGGKFRVSKGGQFSYVTAAPQTREEADQVWQCLFAHKTGSSVGSSGGWIWDESRWMWHELRWDPARKAWVLYTLEEDRGNYDRNIQWLRQCLDQEKRAIAESEALKTASALDGDPFENFLRQQGQVQDAGSLEKVVRELRSQAGKAGALSPWAEYYRRHIPILEKRIGELETEKTSLK